MARPERLLSERGAASLRKPGRHADGGGLYLRRRWVFLFTWQGRIKEMGLGPHPAVPLAEARCKRDEARAVLRSGKNPIETRRDQGEPRSHDVTVKFGEVAESFIAAKASEWRSCKSRLEWRQTLKDHAGHLWCIPVDRIDTAAVLACLQPVWSPTPETGARLRGRIELILDATKARGLRTGENPARWRGHLAHLLPKRANLTKRHHAAMPYADVPAFVARLRELGINPPAETELIPTAALAFEFLILTAARSGEVLGAKSNEIDFASRVWSIPANRMKGGREHRVPLSDRAVAILEKSRSPRELLVFPGRRGMLAPATFRLLMRRVLDDDRPPCIHGFRSSFRDWCGEETDYPRELAEAALAHVTGDATERAYRRGDALEKRRALMEAWSTFVEPSSFS